MKKQLVLLASILASLLLTVSQTQAVLISGTSINDDSQPYSIQFYDRFPPLSDLDSQAAIGFTMPGQSYTLTDVLLRLGGYNGPNEAKVGIYLDNGSGLPGALHALLTGPAAAGSPDNYIFTPAGPVTLDANTPYWLYVDSDVGSGDYIWMAATDAPAGVATFNGNKLSGDGGASFVDSPFNLRYEIRGKLVVTTAPSASVPDAGSTLSLLGLALAGLALCHRRSWQGAAFTWSPKNSLNQRNKN